MDIDHAGAHRDSTPVPDAIRLGGRRNTARTVAAARSETAPPAPPPSRRPSPKSGRMIGPGGVRDIRRHAAGEHVAVRRAHPCPWGSRPPDRPLPLLALRPAADPRVTASTEGHGNFPIGLPGHGRLPQAPHVSVSAIMTATKNGRKDRARTISDAPANCRGKHPRDDE